ncbi:MAG: putative transposase [Pseudonocardiales bacterium]|nr:putative transposase [Pseudonocardiales bacterium]
MTWKSCWPKRGITVDHVTVYRWVQRFTPLLIDAASRRRHAREIAGSWTETYVKVARRWTYLYRAFDQYGQVIDVLVSEERIWRPPHLFFSHALRARSTPDRGQYRPRTCLPTSTR